jgi:thiol-disulfide isomerase/thioredoxin
MKAAKLIVIAFTCNNCPVAVDYEDRFIEFTKKYGNKGVKFIALNVNTTENLEQMKKRADEKDFNFPYAHDADGESYRGYNAKCTPHLFILDGDRNVAYIGSFDDARDVKKVSKNYVADAVDALLAGKKPETSETRPFGCSIKRPGDKK